MKSLLFHVDIETTGPCPGRGSMISLGALYHDPETNEISKEFFKGNLEEVFPRDTNTMEYFWKDFPYAWERATEDPRTPQEVMRAFASWVNEVIPKGYKPVFVADPVGFDWGFVNYYFHNYHGTNPLGYSPRCLASFLQGATGDFTNWASSRSQGTRLDDFTVKPPEGSEHLALSDALAQAKTLQNIINWMRRA